MKCKILVPIAKGTEEMEFTIIADMLRRAGADLTVAGDKEIVVCSRGIKILPDVLIDELDLDDDWDAIVVPGGLGGTENLTNHEHFIEILERHVANNKYYAAICAAPMIFSDHRLIHDDALITSHPSVKEKIRNGVYTEDSLSVMHGKMITSRGAGTAFDFALKLIEILFTEEKAQEIADSIVYSR
jgi:DJ-1 family protein